jgi:type VI secretion system protein ImpA
MALTDLLKSHGDDAPSGENLEYDPAFMSLEIAAQPGEERQIGDQIIAAEDPDHQEVIAQAMDVLGRSHDLRAAVFLAYSYLRTRGFPGFAEVTGYIRGVLEQYWDTCHPQLDPDDDNDPTMRVNAMMSLADMRTIVPGIRTSPLTDSRTFGRFALRDLLIAEGEIAAPEGAENLPDRAQILAAFQDTNTEKMSNLRGAVAQAHEDVKAIIKVFDDKAPAHNPKLEELERVLRQVLDRFGDAGIGDPGEAADVAEETGDAAAEDGEGGGTVSGAAPGGGGGGRGGGVSLPGAINNQNDVKNTLDRLMQYYARYEPSSPVPMLLARAKRLVGADFLTIIKELAPEGESNVNLVAGIKSDADDD